MACPASSAAHSHHYCCIGWVYTSHHSSLSKLLGFTQPLYFTSFPTIKVNCVLWCVVGLQIGSSVDGPRVGASIVWSVPSNSSAQPLSATTHTHTCTACVLTKLTHTLAQLVCCPNSCACTHARTLAYTHTHTHTHTHSLSTHTHTHTSIQPLSVCSIILHRESSTDMHRYIQSLFNYSYYIAR